jgi:TRAP-type C4-dicarboxylate transport system permease small subunit
MTEEAPPAGGEVRPSFPRIRRIDDLWCRAERLVAAALFLLMGLLVFAQVITKVFGRRREWVDVVALYAVVLLGTRTRTVKDGERRLGWPMSIGVAAAVTAGVALAAWLYVRQVPTGLLWAPKLSMVLLIWVAMLGASIATYDRSHLALELGEKLWPQKALRAVRAFAHALASGFCVVLLIVAVEMISFHRAAGDNVADAVTAADPIPILGSLPKWVAFLVLGYAFAAMAIRFLAQAVTTATGTAAPAEERLPS